MKKKTKYTVRTMTYILFVVISIPEVLSEVMISIAFSLLRFSDKKKHEISRFGVNQRGLRFCQQWFVNDGLILKKVEVIK